MGILDYLKTTFYGKQEKKPAKKTSTTKKSNSLGSAGLESYKYRGTGQRTPYQQSPVRPVTQPAPSYTPRIQTVKPTTATKSAYAASAPISTYQTVQAPQTAPVAAPQVTLDDIINRYLGESNNEVNKIYDQQKNSQLAELKAQRDLALGKIKQQQDSTQKDFYNQRNEADVVNAQNVQRLREIMAANGVSASGENLTLNAQANSDRLNALNALNQQEQAQMGEYAAQIADWNNPAREQAVTNQIESARAKALLDAKNAATEKAWREFLHNNLSAAEQAQLAMNRYQIDTTNTADSASNQALIDYYNSLGFKPGSGGGDYNSHLTQAIQRGGVPSSWAGALSELVRRESSFNPNAKNPKSTAHGYGQFLNSTRANYEKKMGLSYSDPVNQLIMMAQYVKDRYGTPQNALAFWDKNRYY